MVRIMITGAGNLGVEIFEYFQKQDNYIPLLVTLSSNYIPSKFRVVENVLRGDITASDEMESIFSNFTPHLLVHTAALTDVEECEAYPDLAHDVNVQGTGLLSRLCKVRNVPMFYISTDQVFGGRKGSYSEIDVPAPINEYGKSKLAGEMMVRKILFEKFAIFRTSFLYNCNFRGYDFISYVVSHLRKGQDIFCDNFRLVRPTPCYCFGKVVENIFSRQLWGLYNICGQTIGTPHEIAYKCAEVLSLDKRLIHLRNEPQIYNARRPISSLLSLKKAEDVLGFVPPTLEDGLLHYYF